MTDSALVFKRAGPASTDLVFGEDLVPVILPTSITVLGTLPALTVQVRMFPPVEMAVTGVLPGLTALVSLRPAQPVNFAGVLPGLSMVAEVSYHSNTQRPIVNQTVSAWQVASEIQAPVQERFQKPLTYFAPVAAHFEESVKAGEVHSGAWADAAALRVSRTLKADDARGARTSLTGVMQDAKLTRLPLVGQFQAGVGVRDSKSASFQEGLKRRNTSVARFDEATAKAHGFEARNGYALPKRLQRESRFQEGRRAPAGISPAYVPPGPLPNTCYTPSGNLIFAELPGSPYLVFACGHYTPPVVVPVATLFILPARFYMTTHNVYAQRLPDLAEVPIFDATVSADAGSFCWALSASGPASLFELLAPVNGLPVQLRVMLDGLPWVFAVDGLSRTHAFGKSGVSVTGRSVTALIGAPYLRAVTRDNAGGSLLAQQLALGALENSGVGLDWGLTDWSVPAGAWSHSGTPLEAVQAIAQAAGGYLQSHRSAPTLLTRHPYSQRTGDHPGAPWGWMSGPADVALAMDAIITEGLERKDGPDINAVYVSGTTQGVLAQVKRTGTAGDKLAAMVTDALITDAVAARQRGLAVLGAAGAKYNVRLDLPVLTGMNQPGVLDVGQLVQVNASTPWRGRVRGVGVSQKGNTLRQTVTLERHLEIA